MIESIQFGSKEIVFELEFLERKSLGISVDPSMHVIVKAPLDTTIDKVKEKIRKRAPWIIRQQSFFLSFHPLMPERKYVSGETHLYLGRQYILKLSKLISMKFDIKDDSLKCILKIKRRQNNWIVNGIRKRQNKNLLK